MLYMDPTQLADGLRRVSIVALAGAIGLSGCSPPPSKTKTVAAARAPCPAQPTGEVRLPGGRFMMGADPLHDEEGPPHEVSIGPFSIDRAEVTNAEFAAFVKATGYVTLAERQPDPKLYPGVDPTTLKPSSLVFVGAQVDPKMSNPAMWWRIIDGADWRHPSGPASTRGGDREPVVQVAYEDALAFARWRGRDLPTEAEWEYAARGGIEGARYTWGGKPSDPKSAPMANTYQGVFPAIDTADDGYKVQPAPVGCFPANGFGLYDMAGNVWEWTRDWYRPGLTSETANPKGPRADESVDPKDPAAIGPKHVVKGGSFLCADDYCFRYRPGAREAGPPDTGASHIGFRTVRRG